MGSAKGGYDRRKKPHASTKSGKPTKRESADELQVTREDMGARLEQQKRHHRSRKPCRKANFFDFFFWKTDRDLTEDKEYWPRPISSRADLG
jgi:hypothetical protein